MTDKILKRKEQCRRSISDMDDLIHGLENCQDLSFNVIEGDDTFNEIHIDKEAQDLFRTILIHAASNLKGRMNFILNNL